MVRASNTTSNTTSTNAAAPGMTCVAMRRSLTSVASGAEALQPHSTLDAVERYDS